jgi:uncharacterized protein YraI
MPIRPTATLKLATRATLAAVLAFPCIAFSQVDAITNQPVNLMAGPGDDYPVVTGLGPDQPVAVFGCVSSYEWCDVALGDMRGWVDGNSLTYAYEGNEVPLESYGAVIGLPVVVFSIDDYWGRYYGGRPWYGDRDRWRHGGPPGGYPGHPYQPPHPGEPYPSGGRPYSPPMQGQGQGQPVYRPNAGPVPHGGSPQQPQGQPQGQPQQQYGGRPPAAVPARPQAQPQPQPQGRAQPNEGRREPQPNP